MELYEGGGSTVHWNVAPEPPITTRNSVASSTGIKNLIFTLLKEGDLEYRHVAPGLAVEWFAQNVENKKVERTPPSRRISPFYLCCY